ncbi:MAG: tRNA pseudouridine(55) synthase TruB [Hymenobacteraceae bacterium]|nr:tRNA pseudouridine(55) synthase TruB [Hymenobacteraceae bacterium]
MDFPLNLFDSDGALWLLDKPLTWTSFDVVNKVRNILRQKVGHAGTLDPLASGLLILGSGKGTKLMESLMGQEKEYTGTLTLGQTTLSADRETAVSQERPWQYLTEEVIRAATVAFTGVIQQHPPLFSAIKIGGKKAYELARKGKDIVPDARPVTITIFEITAIAGPEVAFRVVCSKGTYIRSLARDLGEALGCGAHLSSLVRTRIGDYRLTNAFSLAQMEQFRQPRPEQPSLAPAFATE